MGQGQRWGRHIEACQDSMCTCLYTTFWEILYTMNIRIKGFLRSRKNGKLKSHTKLINDFLNIYFILFLEREGGREKAGEKHPCEREISIDCLPSVPWPGTEPATQAHALTGNQTGELSLCGTMPNQLSHTSQSNKWLLMKTNIKS